MTGPTPTWLHQALSAARFGPYVASSGGDVERASRLYQWNVEVSAAFYVPLHWLEIALRNALNERLRAAYGREDWWDRAPLVQGGRTKVDQALKNARRNSRREGSRSFAPDDVVAELSFGFWVGLLSRKNDRTFWVPILHQAFNGYNGRRDDLHRDLLSMVLFRNRVMHYEPIHHRDLEKDRHTTYRLLEYIGPELAGQVRRHDRVPAVLAGRNDACAGDHAPGL
ncbi:hypothetical protein [Actinomadura roseirufa]|uniref:hypothetical protein n=1 Tax=Actinomadura roseirufa TaxID=2094049 RepID=UPI001041A8DD|nr:hypothetical protein [Actinomadura roseirufa]